jgi:hypothetical protein
MEEMNTFKLLSGLIIAGLILTSTSLVAQKVTIEFDKDTDFTKYKSVSFLGWQEGAGQALNDFDKKRVMDAFKAELEERNLQIVKSSGDIAIALYIVVQQKTSTTAYTNYYGGGAGRGYRRGGRGGWGGGYATTTYSESDYLQGTLVMDVFDGESKDQIWQAVASKTINEKPEKREKSIPKGVKKIMKKFPIAPVK